MDFHSPKLHANFMTPTLSRCNLLRYRFGSRVAATCPETTIRVSSETVLGTKETPGCCAPLEAAARNFRYTQGFMNLKRSALRISRVTADAAAELHATCVAADESNSQQ